MLPFGNLTSPLKPWPTASSMMSSHFAVIHQVLEHRHEMAIGNTRFNGMFNGMKFPFELACVFPIASHCDAPLNIPL